MLVSAKYKNVLNACNLVDLKHYQAAGHVGTSLVKSPRPFSFSLKCFLFVVLLP